tara:strand:- start:370 stop:642 length:273 start_codon:yes stop_codon:yes gene_type:complete
MSNPYSNKKLLAKANRKAKKIGVKVKPSTRKGKKLDVFKDGKKVGSIGAIGYEDFNIHKDKKRRDNYKKRHGKYRNKVGTNSFFADRILW